MTDPVFKAFLAAQWQVGRALVAKTELLDLVPIAGIPPTRYMAEFRCRGLARDGQGAVYQAERWQVMIFFPPDYLRRPIHVAHILTYMGPEPEPWHPNLMNMHICLTLHPGTELVSILMSIHELLTWNLRAPGDALNAPAAQWARNQPPGVFPIDRRPLVWRAPRSGPEHPQPPTAV